MQSFHAHKSDILSLAANQEGSVLFAAGIDGKTTMFNLVESAPNTFTPSGTVEWTMTHTRQFHTHDIRSLVLLEWIDCPPPMVSRKRALPAPPSGARPPQKQSSGRVLFDHLISGGVDTQLTVLSNPIPRFPHTSVQPVRLPPFPKQPMAHLCRGKRLLLTHDDDRLSLWKIGTSQPTCEAAALPEVVKEPTAIPLPVQQGPEFLLDIRVRDGMHILCSDIHRDGSWIAACDAENVHLYRVMVGCAGAFDDGAGVFEVGRVTLFSFLLDDGQP